MQILYAIGFAFLLTIFFYLIKLKIRMVIAANLKANSITKLDADLWKLFSLYIRKKNMDWKGFVYCFTCGKYENYKLVDAGHYIPKAISGSVLKFEPRNVNVQCQGCNRILRGNYAVYKQKLIEKYGQGIIEQLNSLRGQSLTYTDYKDKIKYYSQWLKLH